MSHSPPIGSITWIDLTVDDAESVRDFYRDVVGWESSGIDMGGYEDFCVQPPGQDPVAGICHARGNNAAIPPQWLPYITVQDLDASIARCRDKGGEVVVAPRTMEGQGRYAVIRDPAGAAAALFQPERREPGDS